MELNEAQHQAISAFAAKFCNHSSTGHVHASCHITDVRALVEACLQAADKQPAKSAQPANPAVS